MVDSTKKQVPAITLELRVDDTTAVGTIKNRMRLLTLSGDQKEYDKLAVVKREFEEWGKEKEKK